LKSKLDDVRFLSSYLKKNAAKNKDVTKEKEYDPDGNDSESLMSDEEDDEIKFNRILNKIPDELKVYVQLKTFEQYEKEMKEFEGWKLRNFSEDP
jgi:hypothetical protein